MARRFKDKLEISKQDKIDYIVRNYHLMKIVDIKKVIGVSDSFVYKVVRDKGINKNRERHKSSDLVKTLKRMEELICLSQFARTHYQRITAKAELERLSEV